VKELELNTDMTSIRAYSSSIVISPAMFSSETLIGLRLALFMCWDVVTHAQVCLFYFIKVGG